MQRPDPAASAGPSSAFTDEAAAGNDAARPAAQLAPPEPYKAPSGAGHTTTETAPVSGSKPNCEGDQGTSVVTGPHTARHVLLAGQAVTTTARLTGINAPAALLRSAAAVSQGTLRQSR